MGILYYAPDSCGSSHLWMRRQYENFSQVIDVLVEHQIPDFEIPAKTRLVILPKRADHSSRFLRFFSDIRNDIQRRKILKGHVSRSEIDIAVIHFLTNAVPYQNIWADFKKPVYVHCHGIDVTWEKVGNNRSWRKIWWGEYVQEVLKLPKNVIFIANSKRTKEQLLKIGIESERVEVNYIGVPIPKSIPDRSTLDSSLNTLFIGRLVDVKGPLLTINAFELACENGLEGTLTIAGDGPLRSECENIAAASRYSDRIKILGAVSREQGEQLRMEADLFTAHSRKGPDSLQEEAYGVAFIEAMAAGIPVVTGRSGALPEIVKHGQNGYLFTPNNIEEHAGYLLKCWKEPENRCNMGKIAREYAISEFSLQREMEGLSKIYGISSRLN